MMKRQAYFFIALALWSGIGSLPSRAQFLNDIYKPKTGVTKNVIQYQVVTIEPGKEITLADIKGVGLITYFYITDNSNGNIYRGLVLKMYWDGNKEPSVNVPLADFFGAIDGRTIDYQSMVMQINHLCYMSYIPMPFSKGAKVVLANDGDSSYHRIVAYNFDYLRDNSLQQNDMRFHCYWKRSNPTNGVHELLNVTGDGHYIGNFLQVTTKSKKWWGEGDTRFVIDGDSTTHTPGTEDEYGACWEFGHIYNYIYSGYIEKAEGENRMFRWYLNNPVVFKKSFNVSILNEYVKPGSAFNLANQDRANDDYRSISFWYQHGTQSVSLQSYIERIAPSKATAY